jgi:hypothetical protein
LAASNIPMVVPQTPYNAPMEVPSPTLQNIVSTVNLGNYKYLINRIKLKVFKIVNFTGFEKLIEGTDHLDRSDRNWFWWTGQTGTGFSGQFKLELVLEHL